MVMRPIEADVDRQLLQTAVSHLSPRERDIITMRFGLGGIKELTQKEVADRLGISQSYISRLEKRIILRLRRELQKMELKAVKEYTFTAFARSNIIVRIGRPDG